MGHTEGVSFSYFGAFPISKRIPPSQRPERKLDGVAKEIARVREDAKAEKSDDAAQAASSTAKPRPGRLVNPIGPQKSGGPAPSISTKRPKKMGG